MRVSGLRATASRCAWSGADTPACGEHKAEEQQQDRE
jgi:hypothetical protein